MKNRSILAGYQPRSCLYPKTPKKGPVVYYLQYYLPGGRRVSRPVGKKKKEARLLASEKEFALKSGLFDEFDKKRIPEGILSRLENPKVLFDKEGWHCTHPIPNGRSQFDRPCPGSDLLERC